MIDEAKEIEEAEKDVIKKDEIAADGQMDVEDEEEDEEGDGEEIDMKIKDEGHAEEKIGAMAEIMDENQDDVDEEEMNEAKKKGRRKWKWWKVFRVCCACCRKRRGKRRSGKTWTVGAEGGGEGDGGGLVEDWGSGRTEG